MKISEFREKKMKQHSLRFLALVDESRKHIKEITPQELKEKMNKKEQFSLIDVREDHEWTKGHIPTAIHVGKGVIERDIENMIPEMNTPIVVYCSGGFRCALVADTLQRMGYTRVSSLDTGLQGWLDAGYDMTRQD